MPENIIDPKTLGPVQRVRPNRPLNVSLQDYSNSYDVNYRPEYNQEYNRASNQSGLEQLGYGLVSRTLSIVPKIGSGFGSVVGALTADNISDIWDNPMNDFFNSLDESIKDTLPVYQSRKNAESGLLGKMTTTSFWANDAFDGVAYAASAYVPGSLLGKGLGAAGKALSASKAAQALGLSLEGIDKGAKVTNLALATAYNTVAEAAAEAYQTQHEIEAILVDKGVDPITAKQKAAEAAARTFRANTAVLAVPNLIENIFFHGGIDKAQKAVRRSIQSNLGKVGEELRKTDSIWSKVGGGILTEGFWEENAQTSVQQYERMAATNGAYDQDYFTAVGNNMANNVVGFFKGITGQESTSDEIEGATSIFLGGLIGAGMGAYGAIREQKERNKLIEQEESIYKNLFENAAPAALRLMTDNVGSIYREKGKKTVKVGDQDVEVADYDLDENGNAIIDPEKVLKLTQNQLQNKFLWDAHMLAAYRNDPALAELNKQQALASFVYKLAGSGYDTDQISHVLDRIDAVGTEESKQLGIDEYLKNNIAAAKDYADQLFKISSKRGSSKTETSNPNESKFNNWATKVEFYLNAKQKALENLSQQATTPQGKETIAKLIQDNVEQLRQLNEETSAVKKEYFKTVVDIESMYGEYEKLREKATTPEEKKRLKELTYQLNENSTIEGDWKLTNGSRTLPSGAELSSKSKINVGTQDLYNNEVGRTSLALERTREALASEDPEERLVAVKEFARISVVDDTNRTEVDAMRKEVLSTVDDAVQEIENSNKSNQGLSLILTTLLDPEFETVEGETVGKFFGNQLGEQGPTVLQALQNLGIKIDENTLLDKNFLNTNAEAFDVALEDLAINTDRNLKGLKLLSKRRDQLAKVGTDESPTAKRLAGYNNATNKKAYLEKDFFNLYAKESAKALIETFEENPDAFDNEEQFILVRQRLEEAEAGYEKRTLDPYNTKGAINEYLNILSNVIFKKLQDNLNKRAEIHKVTNNVLVFNTLKSLGLVRNANPRVKTLIEGVLGEEKVKELVDKVFADQDILSFDALHILLQHIKAKADEETLKNVLEALSEYRDSAITTFVDALPDFLNKNVKNTLRSKFDKQTAYQITFALDKYFANKEMPDLVTKFMYDQDLEALAKAAANSRSISDEDKQFIKDLKQLSDLVVGTNLISKWLQLDFKQHDKLIEIKKTLDDQKSPSLQQNIALTQAIQFLLDDSNIEWFNNWLLVRGIGGSGKTFLMGPTLMNIYKQLMGRDLKVYAFSKEKLTTDNVNNALFGKTVNSSLTHLQTMSNEEISKLDFILIDEVYTFTNAEIAILQERLGKVKQETGKVVKVIALGDPSQVTAEETSVIMEALNTQFTIPLTTSYRTNVSSIANFSRQYQLNARKISQPLAQANKTLSEIVADPSTGTGVIAGSIQDLEQALRTPSNRSRVLLVSNPQTKAALKTQFPAIDIKLVNEAQGYQWDEVYTLLDPEDFGGNNFVVNKALYTAFSRPKSLLFIAGSDVSNASPNGELDSNIGSNNTELVKARLFFKENLALSDEAKKILEGVSTFTKEELTTTDPSHDDDPVSEENTVIGPNYMSREEPDIDKRVLNPIPHIGVHEFSYPTNYNLRQGHLGVNALGFVIRTTGENGDGYYIISQSLDNPGKYFVVAKLGDKDFKGSAGEYFTELLSVKKPALSEANIPNSGLFDLPALDRVALGSVVIRDYQSFKTIFDETDNWVNDGVDLMPGAKDVVEDAIIRFYLTYYGPTANGATVDQTNKPNKRWVKLANGRYTVNWSAIGKDINLQIMTRKLEGTGITKDLTVDYGLPYLVINPRLSSVDPNTGEERTAKPILIKFQPKRLAKSSKYVEEIRKLLDSVKAIEAATKLKLSSEEFGNLIRRYAHENLVVSSEPSRYDENKKHYFLESKTEPETELEFHIRQVALSVFGVENRIRYFKSEAEARQYLDDNSTQYQDTEHRVLDGKLVVDVTPSPTNKSLWIFQVSSDPANREDTVPFKSFIPYEGSGPAQSALNTIAQANMYAGYSGEQIRKALPGFKNENGDEVLLTRARSILNGDKPITDYKLLYKDHRIQDLLGDDVSNDRKRSYTQLIDSLEKAIETKKPEEAKDYSSSRSYAVALVNMYTTLPITTDLLEQIAGDEAFDETGQHQTGPNSLRTPLRLHTLDNTGINDRGKKLSDPLERQALNEVLRHNFVGVRKTSVEFGIPADADTPGPGEPKPKRGTIKQVLDNLKPVINKDLQNLVTLFKALNLENKVLEFPNGIPVSIDGKEQLIKPHITSTGQTIYQYAAGQNEAGEWTIVTNGTFDGIDSRLDILSTFLHETLHITTKEALLKGLSDLRAHKPNTKEAIFYKQMSTIKKRFDGAIRSKTNPNTGKKYKLEEVYAPTRSKLDILEFVANLSNPTFIALAKEISLTPKGERKSILRGLVEAILDFFKGILNIDTDTYSAAVAVLENFLGTYSPEQTLKHDVILSPKKSANEVLDSITSALSVDNEFTFESNLAIIQQYFGNIVEGLPSSYGEMFTVKFKDNFNKLPDHEQLDILNKVYPFVGDSLSFAYYNLPQDEITVAPGALHSTKGTFNAVDRIVPAGTSMGTKNLVRTIALKQQSDPELINEIILAADDELSLRDLFFTKIFSRKDKAELLLKTNTTTFEQAWNRLYTPDSSELTQIGNDITNAVKIVTDTKWKEIVGVPDQLEDRSVERFRIAKNFVLEVLRANIAKDGSNDNSLTALIRDRREVIKDLETLAKSPALLAEINNELLKKNKLAELIKSDNSRRAEYNDLVFRTIPALEDRYVALSSLSKKHNRGSKTVLEEIIADIYPKYNFSIEETQELELELQELADADYISRDRLDREQEEVSGISEYIKQYNKSYELTLSEALKDTLSHIVVGDKPISSNLAYIKTIQLVVELDWTQGLDNVSKQLSRALEESGTISSLDRAIISNLKSVIERGTTLHNTIYNDGIELDPSIGVVATTHRGGVVYHAYELPSNLSGRDYTYEELANLDVPMSPRTTNTQALYNWLKDTRPELTVQNFNRHFTRSEAINAIRGIMNTMASMKETELYLATRTLDQGNKFRFIRSKASGVSFRLRDTIIHHITKMYEAGNLTNFPTKFKNTTINGRKVSELEASKQKDKERFIQEFFAQLGFNQDALSISIKKKDIPEVINTINGFLDSIELVASYDEDIEVSNAVGDDVQDFNDWIDETNSTRLTKFSELLSKSDVMYRNPSVRDSKGGKFYKFHESSWAYDTFLNLIEINDTNSVFRGGTGTDTNRRVPTYLRSSLYNNNIFVRSSLLTNKIYSIGEYEAARNEDVGAVTPYTRENKYFFYHRKFVQGFLDGLRQSGSKLTYFQYTYIPSDKPKQPLLKIGLLHDNEDSQIDKALTEMFEQILAKKDVRLDIRNYNESQKNDLFRNFKLGEQALKESKLEFTSENIPKLVTDTKFLMEKKASELLKDVLGEGIELTFDKATYTYLRKLKDKVNSKFSLPTDKFATADNPDEKFNNRLNNEYAVNYDDIIPLFDLFFKNNYVNSFFLNQVVLGDFSAYKKDSSDIVKREAGVFGPKIKGLVDKNIGMKPTFRTLVLADTVVEKQNTRERLIDLLYNGKVPTGKDEIEFEKLMLLFGKNYESTDAQGFILPARARDLTRGFERSWGLGQVHKPLHFGVYQKEVDGYTTAIPVYLKYSAVVLSDDIVDKFPTLKKLRHNLEVLGIDEMIFNSGVKEGSPIALDKEGNEVTLDFKTFLDLDDDGVRAINQYKNSPILELDNLNHGFQHNPSADPTKGVSLFTQLLYFLNVYPTQLANGNYATTQDAAQKSYELLSELIKLGREDFEKQVKDTPSLRRFLLKKFDGPGAERALALLQENISVNHPLLEKRTILSLASGMEKAAIRVKFPGGKLVLQTAEGVDQDYDLQYRMEEVFGKRRLVAEVIVPKELLTPEQLERLSNKESIYLLPDAIGFRIPSTELHSALPLRVKGVYSNEKISNVIIAPKELVPIHGSDFDVDALFVITKEVFTKADNSIVNGRFLKDYLVGIKSLFESLSNLEANSDQDFALEVKTLRQQVKELSGLLVELEYNPQPLDENLQNELENEFQQFVSTPQLIKASSTQKVIRKNIKNYNESRARAEWGAKKGLIYTVVAGVPQWVEDNTIAGKAERLTRKVSSFIDKHENTKTLIKELVDSFSMIRDALDWRKSRLLGHENTPVGFELRDDKYVLDPNFLTTVNEDLTSLQEVDALLQDELRQVVGGDVKKSIERLKTIKQKYLKNAMINTMLDVISDENNKLRMVAPISFDPLTNAIDKINKKLIPSTKYDLGDIGSEYDAYASLTAGAILTGAFANASKTFGYFARAGATPDVQAIYDYYGNLSSLEKALEAIDDLGDIEGLTDDLSDITKEIFENAVFQLSDDFQKKYKEILDSPSTVVKADWVKFINASKNAIRKQLTTTNISKFAKVNTSPLLNSRYKFLLSIDGTTSTFDRLAITDARGEYTVTQVYDALTNEAIDNLKLGDLVKARINQYTGSTVIGLVAVGVPMDVIVKLLYQPILAPLASGKVNNIERWLNKLSKEYNKQITLASHSGVLSDTHLDEMMADNMLSLQNKSAEQLSKSLDKETWENQLRVLSLFMRGYKIGEDMRNTSNFLNLIRTHDVFIEDILQLEDNLYNEIGAPLEKDNDIILQTNTDFSFVIPNLFESAPHVKEAYKTHQSTVALISKYLKLHSEELQDFSAKVYDLLPEMSDRDEVGQESNKQERLANIRKSLSYYILSSIAASRVNVKPEVITVGKADEKGNKNKYTLSKLRTFSNKVATMVDQLKVKDKDNAFLKSLVPVRDWKGATYLSFKSGVNLMSDDVQELSLGFKALNHYHLNEDGKITKEINPGNSVSNIQQMLLDYAIVNYGLQFSNSNFSNYVTPRMFKTTDELYNAKLDAITGKTSTISKDHFVLSHIMQNASKLPYAPSEHIVPSRKGDKKAGIRPIYSGKATITINEPITGKKNVTLYYDLAVQVTSDKTKNTFSAPEYIRRGYGKKISVFRRMNQDGDIIYYQKVGTTQDAFHIPFNGEYNSVKYFDRTRPNIEYHYGENNEVFTYSTLTKVIKTGDKIFIYPSYNFDRTEGREVIVSSVTTVSSSAKAPGYKIKFKEIGEVNIKDINDMLENGQVEQNCKAE